MSTNNDDGEHVLTSLARAVEAATGPLEQLAAIRALADAVRTVERDVVAAARRQRASWAEVGAALGVTKQAVQRRFTDKPAPVEGEVLPADGKVVRPHREPARWDVTTPGGRTLLRIRQR